MEKWEFWHLLECAMVRMLIVVGVVGRFAIDCSMFHFFSLLKICYRNSPFVIAIINFSPMGSVFSRGLKIEESNE